MKRTIGLYGLGVMGQSLALNMLAHEIDIAVYNVDAAITADFVANKAKEAYPVTACFSLEIFLMSLKRPRKIFLMISAGKAVDEVMQQLLPFLEAGDMIMDGGNSFYRDTMRRCDLLKEKGIYYFGVGVSGGEMGALYGPSMMPAGDKNVYETYLAPIFERIAAKTEADHCCCAYIGENGAGHYVKMVHNGIEYADIQIICEAYQLMKEVAGMSIQQIQRVFTSWNKGKLRSYLIEITADILLVVDEKTKKPLVEMILDTAGQKGTGKWASMDGLDMGVPIPTIAESVFARTLSAHKHERQVLAELYPRKVLEPLPSEDWIQQLEAAVYAAKICSYAQGFALLREASTKHEWNLNLAEIALLWKSGCIIRADFLDDISKALREQSSYINLMATSYFQMELRNCMPSWRTIVVDSIRFGIYSPALTSALQYFDGYTSLVLPANLLQAQRDYFGAHTYQRLDDPANDCHTDWQKELVLFT